MRLDRRGIEGFQSLADRRELPFEPGDLRSDRCRISIAQAAELVRNAAFSHRRLPAKIVIVPTALSERFHQFFLETCQRVIHDSGVQDACLQAFKNLALEIEAANEERVFADSVAALRVHRTSVP
jgi:hypothetical protein